MILPILLLSLLYFTAIFFGGAHLWSQSVLILAVFFLAVIWWGKALLDRNRTGSPSIKVIKDPVLSVGLLFLIWVAGSLIPLSGTMVKALSPRTFEVWEAAQLVGARFPQPLSLYPYMTVNSWTFGLFLLVYYELALQGLGSRRQIHWLIMGLLILGTGESIYALIQVATARPYVLWWLKDVSQEVATGSFIYRNHFACFLSMIVCLGVGYLWALSREQKKAHYANRPPWFIRLGIQMGSLGARGILLLLSLALMIAALLVTASRGGTLTLLAGLIIMGGLLVSRYSKNPKAGIFLLALALVGSYVGYVALDRVLERLKFFEEGFVDRLALTQETVRMGRDFPLVGTGLGTFEFVYPRYQERHLEALGDYAHNDWAQLFSETGIVGLILIVGGFLWIMGRFFIVWRRRRDPFSVGIGLGGMGAMVSLSLHLFSDFNLHLPAIALLLALIVAITFLALHSPGSPDGGDRVFYSGPRWKFPLWTGFSLLLLFVLLGGALTWRSMQIWKADSLARTVWNSTLPFKDPSDGDLIKAWSLAPGNAHYWAWIASRGAQKPELLAMVGEKLKKEPKDMGVYLLGQGIRRNPTAWNIWRDLGWTAFLQTVKEPVNFPVAEKALAQASLLRPYAPQGYLESGMIGLAAYSQKNRKGATVPWKEAFNFALTLNPRLSNLVADQVFLYLGPQGARELKGIIPRETRNYLLTGTHLLKKGIYKDGLDYLTEGERFREREIDRLWEEVSKGKSGSPAKNKELIDQILTLDPYHPGALLVQGDLLGALRSQERRGEGVLGDLADRKGLVWNLNHKEDRKEGSPVEIAYFKGVLAEEEGDLRKARTQFQKSLEVNPQFFPAWVRLAKLLVKTERNPGDRIELENLQKKIHFFEMAQVVGDGWKQDGLFEGNIQWKAPYRAGQKKEKMEIHFAGESVGAWKLLLDGRFVSAWAGNQYGGEKKMMIPAGEHEFVLVSYNETRKNQDKLPFKLTITFN